MQADRVATEIPRSLASLVSLASIAENSEPVRTAVTAEKKMTKMVILNNCMLDSVMLENRRQVSRVDCR